MLEVNLHPCLSGLRCLEVIRVVLEVLSQQLILMGGFVNEEVIVYYHFFIRCSECQSYMLEVNLNSRIFLYAQGQHDNSFKLGFGLPFVPHPPFCSECPSSESSVLWGQLLGATNGADRAACRAVARGHTYGKFETPYQGCGEGSSN